MIRGGRMLPDETQGPGTQGTGIGGAGGGGSPAGSRAGDDLTVPVPADQPDDASPTPQPVETRPLEVPEGGPVVADGPAAGRSWPAAQQAAPVGSPLGSSGPLPPHPGQ